MSMFWYQGLFAISFLPIGTRKIRNWEFLVGSAIQATDRLKFEDGLGTEVLPGAAGAILVTALSLGLISIHTWFWLGLVLEVVWLSCGPLSDQIPTCGLCISGINIQLLCGTSRTQRAQWDLNRLELLPTGPSWGERACIWGTEYILFEIPD